MPPGRAARYAPGLPRLTSTITPRPPGRMPLLRAIDSAPNNINLAPESS
jgi:hypothetical protein